MSPRLNQINDHIAKLVASDTQYQALRSVLEKNYASKGSEWINHYSEFLRDYIHFAPGNLSVMWNAANQQGKSNEMEPIAEMLIAYFFKSDDYISDHRGLWGWLDDAYLCNYTLEVINQKCKEQFGYTLLDFDFNACNALAAPFLGDLAYTIQQEAHKTVNKNWNAVETLAGVLLGGLLLYSLMGGGNNGYSGNTGSGSYSRAVESRLASITSGTSLYSR